MVHVTRIALRSAQLSQTYASSGVRTAGSRVNCASKLYVKLSSSAAPTPPPLALTVGTNGGGTPFWASFRTHTHTHTLSIFRFLLSFGLSHTYANTLFATRHVAKHAKLMFTAFGCVSVHAIRTYQIPVDGLEERMARDVRKRGVRMTAKPVSRILVQETAQHLTGFHAERPRNADGALKDHLEQVVLGVLRQCLKRNNNVNQTST